MPLNDKDEWISRKCNLNKHENCLHEFDDGGGRTVFCNCHCHKPKKEVVAVKCWCEGSCPVCRIGEVEDHKCNMCKRTFCQDCHGIESGQPSENLEQCSCPNK